MAINKKTTYKNINRSRKKLPRGKADGGALFIVTTCLSLISLGLTFVGGNLPSKFPTANPNVSAIEEFTAMPGQNTLQLFMIKPKPAALIPTIDPNAPPLSSNRVPTAPASPGGGSGVITAGHVPPTSNNCGGKYNIAKLPGGLNYGDPNCSFTKDALFTLLKQTDPKHASLWYLTIVPGESSYNPNARAAPVGVQLSLDAGGAWGLYQMGSSKPPGQAPPAPGKNGQYDRGDINWEIQTSNAVMYNRNTLKCSFRYWATARAQWGALSC